MSKTEEALKHCIDCCEKIGPVLSCLEALYVDFNYTREQFKEILYDENGPGFFPWDEDYFQDYCEHFFLLPEFLRDLLIPVLGIVDNVKEYEQELENEQKKYIDDFDTSDISVDLPSVREEEWGQLSPDEYNAKMNSRTDLDSI